MVSGQLMSRKGLKGFGFASIHAVVQKLFAKIKFPNLIDKFSVTEQKDK